MKDGPTSGSPTGSSRAAGRVGVGRRAARARAEQPHARLVRQSRQALWAFWLIVTLAIAQVAWWIVFISRLAPDRRHIAMVWSEGTVFVLALLVGVFLLYRALAEQLRIRQQHSTFLASVTHELKSPLAALRLLLETLAAGRVKDPERGRDLARKMLLDVDRLEQLVQNLLRAGELDSAALEPSPRRLDLVPLVRERLERLGERCFGPDDEVRLTVAGPVWVEVDEAMVESVVDNVLDNASKYSSPPRRIEVRVAADPSAARATLEVTDDGVGASADTLRGIFRPFFRAPDAERRAVRGTGLGLYLVRGIARAHGGECDAWSEGPGRGMRITVRLPLAGEPHRVEG